MFPVWQAFSSSGILHHGQTAQWFSWADAPSFTIHRFLWQFCVRGHQQDPFWESRAAGEMLWGRSHLSKGGFQIERWSRSVMSYSLWPYGLACQAPLSIGFSRQEYWSGLPFPSPGHLPDPGIELGSPALQADSSPSEKPGAHQKREVGGGIFMTYLLAALDGVVVVV